MSDEAPIVVPRETVNDDDVLIVRWIFPHGAAVAKGAAVVEIETTKAVLAVEAARDGFLEIARREGERVAVGTQIGAIRTSPAAAAAPSPVVPPPPADSRVADAAGGGPQFSRKARAMMEARGLDAASFKHLSFVSEADVAAMLAKPAVPAGAPVTPATPAEESTASRPTPTATPPAGVAEPESFFASARSSAKNRGWGVVRLGLNYLFRVYLLNLAVRFSPIGVTNMLHRVRGVKVGRGCFIDPTAQLETAYASNITIGDDVRITAHSIIMTHIKAPRYLRENGLVPIVQKPVVLEDHCFIGVGAVIMPGVTIGKASVVTSGAVIVSDVPPYTMASGNPAKVVKRFSVGKTLAAARDANHS